MVDSTSETDAQTLLICITNEGELYPRLIAMGRAAINVPDSDWNSICRDYVTQLRREGRYDGARDALTIGRFSALTRDEYIAKAKDERAFQGGDDEPAEEPPAARAPVSMPKGGKAIAPQVLAVLANAETDGFTLRLVGKLERKLYTATNEVLEALGGKWSRSVGLHVFTGDAGELLGEVLATGCYVDAKKAFQAFYTPADLAARVVDAAQIKAGEWVLEPSAGLGALVRPALEAGGKVWGYEENPDTFTRLLATLEPEQRDFECADFLTIDPGKEPGFDVVVMNPPFSGGQDVRHVMHAAKFLKPGGRLVAIMSPGVKFRETEPYKGFRTWCEAHGATVEDIPAGTFAESGTSVSTVLVTVDL